MKVDPPAPPAPLSRLVAARLAGRQPAPVAAAAAHAAARFDAAALAVLFYGSGLRDGDIKDKILDFYVLVSDYESAFSAGWLVHATRLLPPSVFYDETDFEGCRLRSKVNVISLADFARRAANAGSDITIWARFAQPAALVRCRDEATRTSVIGAVTEAVRRMLAEALPLCDAGADARAVWTTALSLTYGAELRAERPGKAAELVAADADYYAQLFAAAAQETGTDLAPGPKGGAPALAHAPAPRTRRQARRRWRRRRFAGKLTSLLRLIKAAFTFDGGIDYLAWKIARHSGVPVEPAPWQRRHPILGGVTLFLKLRRRGAFR